MLFCDLEIAAAVLHMLNAYLLLLSKVNFVIANWKLSLPLFCF
jgi:hypothetical protein